jgi:ferritin-like metal-binding protein YciE
MEGLIAEGQEAIELQGEALVRDAALIAAAQRVEHYEIAAYGTVRALANHLGHKEQVELLQTTLDEEGMTDKQLTAMAEGGFLKAGINEKAEEAGKSKTKA